jgi:hypothetical protein
MKTKTAPVPRAMPMIGIALDARCSRGEPQEIGEWSQEQMPRKVI